MVQQITALKGELKATREDTAVLRKIVDGKEEKMTKMKKKIEELSLKAENDKSEARKADYDFMRRLEELGEMMNASRRMQEDIVGRLDKLADAVNPNWFVWRIEGIWNDMDKFSSPFYSDGTTGYKLCLWFHTSSSANWLVFALMRGDYDNRLQWPMNRIVLIEIINEKTKLPVFSQRVSRATTAERVNPEDRKKAYDKPDSERNTWTDGIINLPSYEQIKSTTGAIHNDAMTVRCRVMPQ